MGTFTTFVRGSWSCQQWLSCKLRQHFLIHAHDHVSSGLRIAWTEDDSHMQATCSPLWCRGHVGDTYICNGL